MAHKSSLLSGIALGAALSGSAWYGASTYVMPSVVGAAEASAPTAEVLPPAVNVFTVTTRSITEWDEFTGRFEAVDEVAIRARVAGHLEAVHFKAGQVVEQGDLLFSIDPRPFEAALAEAQARATEASATGQLALSELARAQQLHQQGHVSEAVLETREQDAAIARASIAMAEAAVERARLDLEYTQIHAPVTGRISDDFISEGNLVAAGVGTDALTTIVSLDPIHFVFDATEQQYLEYTRAGGFGDTDVAQRVAVQLMDDPAFSHEGEVDFVDNRIDRSTGTIRGRAVIDNKDGMLVPGMFGRMRLAAATLSDRILIPDLAIISDQAAKFVWVVDAQGAVARRDVKLSGRHDDLRIVTGLQDGEQVIVSGLHMVSVGAQVRVQEDTGLTSTEIAMR